MPERVLSVGPRLLMSWRLVVQRPPGLATTGRRPSSVDMLECAAFLPELQDHAAGWAPGEVVEVVGALRRRFWRAGAAVASRCEVEVTQVRQVTAGLQARSGVGEGAQQ